MSQAGLRPVDDDDDYNNRAFRGFEITVRASLVQIIYWLLFQRLTKRHASDDDTRNLKTNYLYWLV